MSRKYKFRNPEAAYFVSFATCFWIDVFTRQCYFSILEESQAGARQRVLNGTVTSSSKHNS
jgi:hypothetical protein